MKKSIQFTKALTPKREKIAIYRTLSKIFKIKILLRWTKSAKWKITSTEKMDSLKFYKKIINLWPINAEIYSKEFTHYNKNFIFNLKNHQYGCKNSKFKIMSTTQQKNNGKMLWKLLLSKRQRKTKSIIDKFKVWKDGFKFQSNRTFI